MKRYGTDGLSGKLTKQQRSQALGWVSVMGFNPRALADHFGLTADEIAAELIEERKARKLAGKSSEPVPVVVNQGKQRLNDIGVSLGLIDALQTILRDCENMSEKNAVWRAKYTAQKALKNIGFLL